MSRRHRTRASAAARRVSVPPCPPRGGRAFTHDGDALRVLQPAEPVVALLARHVRRHAEGGARRVALHGERPEVRPVDPVLRRAGRVRSARAEKLKRERQAGGAGRGDGGMKRVSAHVCEAEALPGRSALVHGALAAAAVAVVVEEVVDHNLYDCGEGGQPGGAAGGGGSGGERRRGALRCGERRSGRRSLARTTLKTTGLMTRHRFAFLRPGG